MCEASAAGDTAAQETAMKALAGLTALVIALMGSTMLMKTPGAAPIIVSQTTEDQDDVVPPYISFDRDAWR